MAPKKRKRVPVSMRALVQRINRKLAAAERERGGEPKLAARLKAARGDAVRALGDYYLVDVERNAVERTDVDPEALGRELGALAAWEEVSED